MIPLPAAAPPPLSSVSTLHKTLFIHLNHHHTLSPISRTFTLSVNSSKRVFSHVPESRIMLKPPLASISRYSSHEDSESNVYYDPELRAVLELATDSELYEIERILFGPSYFSPLLKSLVQRSDVDQIMIGEDPEERENFISMLESRFLFLAADARSTIRGWRPSYRKVLLELRKKLNIPCSAKLSAEGLEVEIFLHLLEQYSSEEPGSISSSKSNSKDLDACNNLELGLSKWKVQKLAALGIGAAELRPLLLKGGGMLSLEKLFELVGGKLSSKFFSEAANYQIKKEVIKKGGQLAALNLEAEAAFLIARQGLETAAVRYLGLRSLSQLIGPVMWGTLLADVVIQMIGTDYARIMRAVYAFAQIRIYRSHITSFDAM